MDRPRDGWNKAKQARIVPKDKAARAYEQTVRRRVDPALAEWAGPGVFNARVFPIAPKKLHRVVVGYDMNLTRIDGALEFRLPMPDNMKTSRVHLDVQNLDGARLSVSPETPTREQSGRKHVTYANPTADVIKARLDGVGAAALTGADDVGPYFAARFAPELDDVASEAPTERAVFVVDTSLSSNPDRFNIWRNLLRAVLRNNRPHLKEFAVVFFNVEQFWWKRQFVANTEANVRSLMDSTDTLALEGATDLGATLEAGAAPSWTDSSDDSQPFDLFLLSDANVTWGEGDVWALSRRLEQADARMLDHLARQSGGNVFSVVGESQVDEASKAHTARPWHIEEVSVGGTSGDLLLAGRPRTVYPNQRLFLVGRGNLPPSSTISLKLSRDGTTETVEVPLSQNFQAVLSQMPATAFEVNPRPLAPGPG